MEFYKKNSILTSWAGIRQPTGKWSLIPPLSLAFLSTPPTKELPNSTQRQHTCPEKREQENTPFDSLVL